MKRDISLETDLPPEKLAHMFMLGLIPSEETEAELIEKLCNMDGERSTDNGKS